MRNWLGRAVAVAAAPVLIIALGGGSAAGRSPGTVGSGQARAPAAAPAGFEPVSASFMSVGSGYVLGTRGHTRLPGAALVVKTVNGGRTWAAVTAPPVRLVNPVGVVPGTSVSAIRFADASNGWLFNPALWVTHDGGRHWRQLSLLGTVHALATSGGQVFASVAPRGGGPARLYTSPVGADRWTRVPAVVPAGVLTFSGHAGWAGLPPNLWATSDLRHWHKLPAFQAPRNYTPQVLAAGSSARLVLVCGGDAGMGQETKLVYASANGGVTFSRAGSAPRGGFAAGLAVPPGRPQAVTLAAVSAASWLYQSADGGRTWRSTVRYDDGGAGWHDLRYVSPAVGWLVHGSSWSVNLNALMRTVNAGATWYKVAIP
jgi:photosystem II stability/assembly factor-like uncharacterized protein